MIDNSSLLDIVTSNVSITELSPEIISAIGGLITILKTAGIIFIVYLVFLIISSYLNIKRSLRIKRIDKVVQEMDKKLDKVLKSSKEKHKRESKKKN